MLSTSIGKNSCKMTSSGEDLFLNWSVYDVGIQKIVCLDSVYAHEIFNTISRIEILREILQVLCLAKARAIATSLLAEEILKLNVKQIQNCSSSSSTNSSWPNCNLMYLCKTIFHTFLLWKVQLAFPEEKE